MEQDILLAAEPKLEHVLLLHLVVTLGLLRKVAFPEPRDDVGAHPAAHGALSSGVPQQAVLEDGVVLGAGGVIHGKAAGGGCSMGK